MESKEELAEEHSEWYMQHFAKISKQIYRDAFIHGYKHGMNKPIN